MTSNSLSQDIFDDWKRKALHLSSVDEMGNLAIRSISMMQKIVTDGGRNYERMEFLVKSMEMQLKLVTEHVNEK
ncbi:hypothetical protein PFISCL1PPCAC_28641, partial [Pristionchus fissidentatus]